MSMILRVIDAVHKDALSRIQRNPEKKDEKLIYDYRNRIMEGISIEDAKKAFEENIWNGLNPKEPATREEVAAMIHRALEQLK